MTEQQFKKMMERLEEISNTLGKIHDSIDDIWIAVTGDGYEYGDINHGLHDKIDDAADRIVNAVFDASK